MLYTQNIDNCLKGTARADFDKLMADAKPAVKRLLDEADSGERPLFNLDADGTDINQIEQLAQHIRSNFKHMLILGTGGSTLTGQTLVALKEMEQRFNNPPTHIHFMENVDPHTFEQLFNGIDIQQTCFLVISKSGGTLETLAQFAICLNIVKQQLGEAAVKERFWIISDPKDNPLRRIAAKHNIADMEHVEKIGGRFSILTNVALLPAAVAGLDIRKIREGAKQVINNLRDGSSLAPIEGAAINLLLEKKGITHTVLMPYIDRLMAFTYWFRQIWAESLGKNGKGTTPIRSLGTIDQHSQQQLYIDGPRNKMFTFITLNRRGEGHKLDKELLDDDSLTYMHDSTLGDVITVSCDSVYQTFVSNNLPVREIKIDRLDEEVLGALAMHFIIETVICGYIQNIDPYNQPAVENAKNLAKELLSK